METRLVFSVSFLVSVLIPISEANVTCTVNEISYLCQNIASKTDFPHVLPAHIKKVTLIGEHAFEGSFPDGLFNHQTWRNITELSIFKFNRAKYIKKTFLNGLEELKYLSISSCPFLEHIDPDVFHSTPDLEALDLDENSRLEIDSVEAALHGKLCKLKYISLIGIHNVFRHVILGENFSKALYGKNLTYADISEVSIIYVEHYTVLETLKNIKYLNVSYSTLISAPGISPDLSSFIKNIELFDGTGSQYMIQDDIVQGDYLIKDYFPQNATYIFLQGMIYPLTQLKYNAKFSYENCDSNGIKMLDISKNNIIILNITFLGACRFRALETLNLASNKMEYISPAILSSFPSLKILDLSSNQLHNMQAMDDFSYLFSQNKDLEIIFLRNNHLSVVPSNLFSSNTKLRLIDLSENELTYFNIEFQNTWDLKLMNLSNNRLKSLPVTFLAQMEQTFRHQSTVRNQNPSATNILLSEFQDRNLIGKRYKYEYSVSQNVKLPEKLAIIEQYVMLNLLENHIVCDCDTIDFLKWILFTDISIVNRTTLVCKYGNNEEFLNNAVFEMVRENCRLAKFIGIGIGASVAIILCMFAFAIMIRLKLRKARQNQDLENLKREILHGNTHFSFVVFLSYCSQDSYIVEENILPSLNRYLKKIFNTEKDLVCTGADNFVPGMLIIEEIHRCINKCLVLVPVITPAFLESRWSMKECVDAIEKHRQVVVLMKQHTDTFRTIGAIKHLIAQYTRATWSDNEGHFVIRPSWNTICEGIINGASETFRNYLRQNVNTSIESLPLVDERV